VKAPKALGDVEGDVIVVVAASNGELTMGANGV
jgi:hypothetical protein